jgi:osmotically-inducible protein OsmY
MNIQRTFLTIAICATSVAMAPAVQAQTSDSSAKPDNTAVNQRDRDSSQPTADKQKNDRTDRELTKHIRRSIIADKSLSTYAHNVKIISQNGAVTLKGPVKSDDEKASVIAKAVAVVGSADKVTDQVSVKQ